MIRDLKVGDEIEVRAVDYDKRRIYMREFWNTATVISIEEDIICVEFKNGTKRAIHKNQNGYRKKNTFDPASFYQTRG